MSVAAVRGKKIGGARGMTMRNIMIGITYLYNNNGGSYNVIL